MKRNLQATNWSHSNHTTSHPNNHNIVNGGSSAANGNSYIVNGASMLGGFNFQFGAGGGGFLTHPSLTNTNNNGNVHHLAYNQHFQQQYHHSTYSDKLANRFTSEPTPNTSYTSPNHPAPSSLLYNTVSTPTTTGTPNFPSATMATKTAPSASLSSVTDKENLNPLANFCVSLFYPHKVVKFKHCEDFWI